MASKSLTGYPIKTICKYCVFREKQWYHITYFSWRCLKEFTPEKENIVSGKIEKSYYRKCWLTNSGNCSNYKEA